MMGMGSHTMQEKVSRFFLPHLALNLIMHSDKILDGMMRFVFLSRAYTIKVMNVRVAGRLFDYLTYQTNYPYLSRRTVTRS